jgi:hypothetical protein
MGFDHTAQQPPDDGIVIGNENALGAIPWLPD